MNPTACTQERRGILPLRLCVTLQEWTQDKADRYVDDEQDHQTNQARHHGFAGAKLGGFANPNDGTNNGENQRSQRTQARYNV